MANLSIPPEERDLTPQQVEALDRRRNQGALLLTIAGQFTVIAVLLTLWIGNDLIWSPGFAKPMDIYFLVACAIVAVCAGTGVYLRRGAPEY